MWKYRDCAELYHYGVKGMKWDPNRPKKSKSSIVSTNPRLLSAVEHIRSNEKSRGGKKRQEKETNTFGHVTANNVHTENQQTIHLANNTKSKKRIKNKTKNLLKAKAIVSKYTSKK